MNPVGPKSSRVAAGTGPGAPGNDSNGWNLEGGSRHTSVRTPKGPLEHVHDVAIDGDPVADHAVLGRHPPRDEGGQGARRGARSHRGDGSPGPADQHRDECGALPELFLAESVDHEEHDLLGPRHHVGEPPRQRRPAGVGQLVEQGRAPRAGGTGRPSPGGPDRAGLRAELPASCGPGRRCLGGSAVTHEGTPYDPHTPSTHERAGRITGCEELHAG